MRRKIRLLRFVLLGSVAVLSVLLSVTVALVQEATTTVRAARVEAGPGSVDDSLWARATPLAVQLSPYAEPKPPAGEPVGATIKALWTATDLYLLVRWTSPSGAASPARWQFDGTSWQSLPEEEDRLALMWPIGTVARFANDGCAAACHYVEGAKQEMPNAYLGTNSATERVDLWQWGAGSGQPPGSADDWYIGEGHNGASGLRPDPGDGAWTLNEAPEQHRPAFWPAGGMAAPVVNDLPRDRAVPIPPGTTFRAGDTLPRYLSGTPSGGRADIHATATYRDGAWQVMLSRPLRTGRFADVAFEPGKDVSFGLAVWRRAAGGPGLGAGPLTLQLLKGKGQQD